MSSKSKRLVDARGPVRPGFWGNNNNVRPTVQDNENPSRSESPNTGTSLGFVFSFAKEYVRAGANPVDGIRVTRCCW